MLGYATGQCAGQPLPAQRNPQRPRAVARGKIRRLRFAVQGARAPVKFQREARDTLQISDLNFRAVRGNEDARGRRGSFHRGDDEIFEMLLPASGGPCCLSKKSADRE